MDAFWEHKFPECRTPRTETTVLPKLRLCVCAQVLNADRICFPFFKNRTITKRIPEAPCFYLAKELKKLGEAEMNKTMFTRMVGTAYLGQRPYAVYNTRSARDENGAARASSKRCTASLRSAA